MTSLVSHRRTGAISNADRSVHWRVWAPRAQKVELVLWKERQSDVVSMPPDGGGFFSYSLKQGDGSQRYSFRLDGGDDRPDPCSLFQPLGVPGPSEVVCTNRWKWNDAAWKGVRREELVLYELHVGTFTNEGTFEAIIPRLQSLRDLGITAIELMPIGQFPGTRNWGYDGVLPYAAQNSYGGPDGLARLVDAAHTIGLAVFLDVVYNHLGPEANYLEEFGPYLTDKYKTPWGKAINYDDRGSDPVRDYVLDNARMWLEEFHLDGLRLDAVHAIYDLGARHILQAIQEVAEQVSAATGRLTHIIAESDLNDPKMLLAPDRGGHGLAAQWSDDFHHSVHAFLTGEQRGYYADYGNAQHLVEVLNSPFMNPWRYSPQRGRKHGASAEGLTGDRFVVCIQNHDQVGNRAKGDRLGTLLQFPAKQRLAACLMLLSPYLPMLFMGEEYGETRPFPFFCSFSGTELIQAVREGRKREFAEFVTNTDEVPIPDSQDVYDSAKLSWSWPRGSFQAGLRQMYSDLLSARRGWPALKDFKDRSAKIVGGNSAGISAGIVELIRGGASVETEGIVRIFFNLTDQKTFLPDVSRAGCGVLFSSEAGKYAGARLVPLSTTKMEMLAFECAVVGPADWKSLAG